MAPAPDPRIHGIVESTVTAILPFLLGLLPVLAFLVALMLIDSFKLIRPRMVVLTILIGGIAAVTGYLINSRLSDIIPLDPTDFSRYVAPWVEECVKTAFVVYLVSSRRVGFAVDSAINGFAVGAGFAFIENLYYLRALADAPLAAWVVRGFGTAVMHGGTTAIFAIMARALTERWGDRNVLAFLPGLLFAVTLHSLFNHFILPPVISTAVMVGVFPVMVAVVFNRSEKATRQWLGTGLDSDFELLDLITSGKISDSHIGLYLENLRHRFPVEVVVDMLCYMRLHLELALQAKGVMMLRQANLNFTRDPELQDQLAELRHLERHIGVTGKLAITPFLRTSSRDLWQIYMLDDQKSLRA